MAGAGEGFVCSRGCGVAGEENRTYLQEVHILLKVVVVEVVITMVKAVKTMEVVDMVVPGGDTGGGSKCTVA